MLSCSRRKILGLMGVWTIGACGFAPLYGGGTSASAARGQIDVAQIDGLMGYKLRERLSGRLGPPNDATHQLSVQIKTASRELAINQENEITRYSLTGTAQFQLRQLASSNTVLTGNVRAFAAYSATASAYATSVAERDARERLANALAEQIATRITASADRWLA